MSCTLNSISQINDLNRIGKLLDDHLAEEQEIVDQGFDNTQSWDDDWESAEEWNDTIDQTSVISSPSKKPWLQSCHVSLSPTEEILVITKKDKCVFLTQKWTTNPNEPEADTPTYEVSWNGCLSQGQSDNITSVSCIPLASQHRSSEGSPDWTCVIAGFSSGYIRIYMTNGKQLLAQYLHDEPVISIKLKTKTPFYRLGDGDQVEELTILYPHAIVTIDGFSLYQSLRACRNQLAKAQAWSSYGEMPVDPPPLEYHKWRITTNTVNDISSCGTKNLCLFDRLLTSSVLEGQHGVVKGSAPAFTSLITAGKDPFLAVYHATEGGSQLIISDVALAVASKLTSAVVSRLNAARGWFGAGRSPDTTPTKDTKPKVEIGTLLNSTVCLPDSIRNCGSIKVAPIGHLAVATDSFNRVLLLDTSKGVVVRMWKGYRDAECGWIVVDEDIDNNSLQQQQQQQRRALFLVIYAPKRGIMEIYLMEHGRRVGAFDVGKECRLLYPGYSPLGQTHSNQQKNTTTTTSNQCFLLQSDGIMKCIHVPFHLALSTTHSVQAKDSHLLQRLSNLISKAIKQEKQDDNLCKSLSNIVLDIQVPSSQRKGIEIVLTASHLKPTILQSFTQNVINNLKKSKRKNNEEDIQYKTEKDELLLYCQAQLRLIDLYISVEELHMSHEGADSEPDFSEGKETALTKLLHITVSEAKNFLYFIQESTNVVRERTPRKIIDSQLRKDPFNITTFLSCFTTEIHERKEKNGHTATSAQQHFVEVQLQDSVPQPLLAQLGHFIFHSCLCGELPISKLTLLLENSQLHPNQIMMLATLYTQSNFACNMLEVSTLFHLTSLVSSICSLKGGLENEATDENCAPSSWWQTVRDILQESTTIRASYVMAFVCRSVAIELRTAALKIKKEDLSELTSDGWEAITIDMQQWNFLTNQLENLVELDRFVHTNHSLNILSGMESPSFNRHRCATPKSTSDQQKSTSKHTTTKVSQRTPPMSVQGVLNSGFGSISQIVADCLVRQGVPGPCLGVPRSTTNTPRDRQQTLSTSDEAPYDEDRLPEQDEQTIGDTLTSLVELRKIFPFSLEQDILWTHCAWESIMLWNEDSEDVNMLASALIHLSCINNPVLKEGLSIMMWKAVFKDSIKELTALIDKIGKAPKDRLCKKTVSLGYKALEEFLSTAKRLLEVMLENDFENDMKPELKEEDLWQSNKKSSQRSIVEQAINEHCCNRNLLTHQWCHVTILYLIMASGVKSIKPSNLFDTKGRHALFQPLHVTPILSKELDDTVMKAREKEKGTSQDVDVENQFCTDVAKSLVDKYTLLLTECSDDTRSLTALLLSYLDTLSHLTCKLYIDEDFIRRQISFLLYNAGLDLAAQEISMLVEDKDTFSSHMLEVVRKRLAFSLLNGDGEKISNTLSQLPTKITSWLQTVDVSKVCTTNIPLLKTYHLLQYLYTNVPSESKEYRFINELIEALQPFIS